MRALCLGDMWPEQDGVRVCRYVCTRIVCVCRDLLVRVLCCMFRRHVARAGRCVRVCVRMCMYACCALCLGDMWPDQDGVHVCRYVCTRIVCVCRDLLVRVLCSMFRRHVARAGRCACVCRDVYVCMLYV